MFLNPIWSMLLLAVCITVYVAYMRPRLKAHFAETYVQFDSAWAKAWYVATKFKKTVTLLVGLFLTALPDLLVQIAPVDFSKFLPERFAGIADLTGPLILFLVAIMRGIEAANAATNDHKTGG